MTYSIGEVSKMLNISISTLRYYDKEGLLPLVKRSSGKIRLFDDSDIECLRIIDCLKSTGMQIKDIKQYFQWCELGDDTLNQRYELFLSQREKTIQQIALLQESLNRIEYKCEYYRKACEKGSTQGPELENSLSMKFLKK